MAIPGILQQIAKSNPIMNSVKGMIGMLNTAQNPQMLLNQMFMNNPKMKEITDLVNGNYGGDWQKAFYAVAQQKGVDPNDILNMMR